MRPFALLSLLSLTLACGPPEDIGLGPDLPKEVFSLNTAERTKLAELLQAGGLHETERNRYVKLAVKPEWSSAEQKELNEFDKKIDRVLLVVEEKESLKKLRILVKLAGVLEKAELRRLAEIQNKSERTDEEKSFVADCEKFVKLKNKSERAPKEETELVKLRDSLSGR